MQNTAERNYIGQFCRPCEERYWPADAAPAPVADQLEDPTDAAPAPVADQLEDPADAVPLEGSFDVGHRRASIHPEPMDT